MAFRKGRATQISTRTPKSCPGCRDRNVARRCSQSSKRRRDDFNGACDPIATRRGKARPPSEQDPARQCYIDLRIWHGSSASPVRDKRAEGCGSRPMFDSISKACRSRPVARNAAASIRWRLVRAIRSRTAMQTKMRQQTSILCGDPVTSNPPFCSRGLGGKVDIV